MVSRVRSSETVELLAWFGLLDSFHLLLLSVLDEAFGMLNMYTRCYLLKIFFSLENFPFFWLVVEEATGQDFALTRGP